MQERFFQIKQIIFCKRIFFALCCILIMSYAFAACGPDPNAPCYGKIKKPKTEVTLINKLKQRGIVVVLLGDEVLLVVPANTLYPKTSPRLMPEARSEVNDIAAFIKMYKKDAVFVKGYTDALGDPARNMALARQQAQNLADYLWWQGIDARMIVAEGYGASDPVSTNRTPTGRKQNRRIEILFRQITD